MSAVPVRLRRFPPSARTEPDVVETHLSTLVFAGEFVYKFFKVRRHSFLDASTSEARLRLCRQEVEQNRRLAPDVYLGVADIGLEGRVADHAVVMRRLPAGRSLAALLLTPEADEALRQVIGALVGFHRTRPPLTALDEPGGAAQTVAERWAIAFGALRRRPLPPPARLIDENEELASRYLAENESLFEQRLGAGWVRDAHGDLLAEDCFCLPDGARLLDCLAFDNGLRCVDVLADVCFLAESVERLPSPASALDVLSLYDTLSGVSHPQHLAHHYIAYRAHVRASVTVDPIVGYLERARQHLWLAVEPKRATNTFRTPR